MVTSFVPLRLRSRYSLFAGTMPPGEIASRLAAMGFTAGALVDRGNLYGAVEFYQACLKENIKPIIGAQVSCPATGRDASLIALDRDGYASLCQIITDVNLEPDTSLVAAVARSPRGVAALAADPDYAVDLTEALGRERVWVEIVGNRAGRSSAGLALSLARARGLSALGSWETLCGEPSEEGTCRILRAVGSGRLVSKAALDAAGVSVVAVAGLARELAGRPELLAESKRLAEMANLRLDLGMPHFPKARPTKQESAAALRAMCSEALASKYGGRAGRATARLEEELRVIDNLGLADYFLVVADVVAFAKRSSIPVSGRGSGAGSIVAYLLDVTQVDPVANGLVFERFLNEHRPDYPDLDLDVSWKKRDDLIDYVYRRYGKAQVAMISTRACFETRSAAREVAKAFGLSPYEAQALADSLPHGKTDDLPARIARVLGDIRPELTAECRRRIGQAASAIVGFPNHSSVHCGGVVVSDRPITYYTPLEMAAKGIQITQFDMHSVEKIGLVKIDLLGNRVLSLIEEAGRDVESRHGGPFVVPEADAATASLLAGGRTLSCFQLESPAMRSLLAMMRAETREDATVALALVRPGPSAGGMKERFIADRHRLRAAGEGNKMPIEGYGGNGDGLPVYEEDVMRMIARSTGVTLAEADIFRRSLKDGGQDGGPEDKALEERFLFLAATAGVSAQDAREAWQHVRRFAAYSFCKAHAASFGALAFAAAYLKANFPLEFYAAVLRNHSGMYPLWTHVNEARRCGVPVRPPSVNASRADFQIEADGIRTGLASVKHLSQPTLDRTLAERKHGPFASLADYLSRVPADKEETVSLVAAGAFDTIEPDRCRLLTECFMRRGRPPLSDRLGLGLSGVRADLPTRSFSPTHLRKMEYSALAFSPLVHPLEFFVDDRAASHGGCNRAARSRALADATGLLAAVRYYKGAGPGIHFLTLDNPAGLHECVMSAGIFSERLDVGNAYQCAGILQVRFGVPSLRIRSIRRLPERFA